MPPKKKTAVAKKAATASNGAAAGSPMSDRRKRGGAKSAAAAVAPSPPPPEKESRKRGRPQGSEPAAKAKKAKLSPAVGGVGAKSLVPHLGEKGGVVLALGQGDTGQLGLGEDIMERSKPAFVKELASEEIMDICAGGMHSMALSKNGEVRVF